MRKTLCAFLVLLLLSGCAALPQPTAVQTLPTETAASEPAPMPETEPEPPKPGLYELISYSAEGGYRPLSLSARGNEAAVLLCPTPATEERVTYYAQLLNLDTGEPGEILPLERSEETDYYLLSLEEDGSLISYDPYEQTAARYDRQGKLLGSVDNPYPAEESFRFPHALADDWFTFRSDCAYCHSYTGADYLFTAYAFADEPEALYLLGGGSDSVCCAKGRTLLESSYLPDNGGLAYRVLDLENGRELDRLRIENEELGQARENTWFSDLDAVFCDAGALLRVERTRYDADIAYGEDGPEPDWEQRVCLWRFDDSAAQPVEPRRVTEEELLRENAELAAHIGEDYEINVVLDAAPEGDTPPLMEGDDPEELADAELITGIEPLRTYELLRQLERFLKLLPEGFTHEMQTDFPEPPDEYGLTGFDGFDIYVVKEIPGGSSAYANGWGERLKIVFATDEFSASTVPHEFMHLIERRIFAWYESVGESFWDAWDALNPEGFDYYDGEDKWELVGDWFVSSYAMTDSMEDRAETFMEVFTAQTPLEECFWYQEGSHVPAKVAFLREAIRRSYPSVQAVEQAYWEGK